MKVSELGCQSYEMELKMRGYIENLNNNIRYKILKSDREVYLIDLQQYLISYFSQ